MIIKYESMGVELSSEYYIDIYGVLRWNSNDRCIPIDFCKKHGDKLVNLDLFLQTKSVEEENRKTIAEYKKYREENGYSAEELAEIKNAFGDEPVVNVITGERIQ